MNDDLVRDVAKLVAKYGLGELGALLQELREGNGLDELAQVIGQLERRVGPKPLARQGARKPRTRPAFLDDLFETDEAAGRALDEFRGRLVRRVIFPDAKQLKTLWSALGRKDPVPMDRRKAISATIHQLANDGHPDELPKRIAALERLGSVEDRSSYADWAATIMGEHVDPKPHEDNE